MKYFTLFFVFIFFTASYAKCQVSSSPDSVSVALPDSIYTLSVIIKVQDVVNAVNIPQSEQVSLANFFVGESNTVASEANGTLSGSALDAANAQLIAQFQSILSPQELIQFSLARPDSEYALPAAATDIKTTQ